MTLSNSPMCSDPPHTQQSVILNMCVFKFLCMSFPTVTAHLVGVHSAMKMLVERLRLIQGVVAQVEAGA